MTKIIVRIALMAGMITGNTLTIAATTQPATQPTKQRAVEDVKAHGAFGFPQEQAEVLCDTPDLRASVWNNGQYLYVQAVLWRDSDPTGEDHEQDGRRFGDASAVSIDVDADGKETVDVDRTYYVNPLVTMPGLNYVVCKGEGATSGLQNDSAGRGSVQYLIRSDGSKFRVDSFLIPLAEIHRSAGAKIGLAFWAMSVRPRFAINSLGMKDKKYVFQLPMDQYHALTLSDRSTTLDPMTIPEGRKEKASQ